MIKFKKDYPDLLRVLGSMQTYDLGTDISNFMNLKPEEKISAWINKIPLMIQNYTKYLNIPHVVEAPVPEPDVEKPAREEVPVTEEPDVEKPAREEVPVTEETYANSYKKTKNSLNEVLNLQIELGKLKSEKKFQKFQEFEKLVKNKLSTLKLNVLDKKYNKNINLDKYDETTRNKLSELLNEYDKINMKIYDLFTFKGGISSDIKEDIDNLENKLKLIEELIFNKIKIMKEIENTVKENATPSRFITRRIISRYGFNVGDKIVCDLPNGRQIKGIAKKFRINVRKRKGYVSIKEDDTNQIAEAGIKYCVKVKDDSATSTRFITKQITSLYGYKVGDIIECGLPDGRQIKGIAEKFRINMLKRKGYVSIRDETNQVTEIGIKYCINEYKKTLQKFNTKKEKEYMKKQFSKMQNIIRQINGLNTNDPNFELNLRNLNYQYENIKNDLNNEVEPNNQNKEKEAEPFNTDVYQLKLKEIREKRLLLLDLLRKIKPNEYLQITRTLRQRNSKIQGGTNQYFQKAGSIIDLETPETIQNMSQNMLTIMNTVKKPLNTLV
jgi:hypothetical protein